MVGSKVLSVTSPQRAVWLAVAGLVSVAMGCSPRWVEPPPLEDGEESPSGSESSSPETDGPGGGPSDADPCEDGECSTEEDCSSCADGCHDCEEQPGEIEEEEPGEIEEEEPGEEPPEQQQILEVPIAGGENDAEERSSGSMYLTSSDLELTEDGSPQVVGLRFVGVDIAPNATIHRAFVQFVVDEVTDTDTSLVLRAEAADNAQPFTMTAGNLSSRGSTLVSVPWQPESWTSRGMADEPQRTPDLAGVVQEVISRPGWEAGNALVVLIRGTGRRVAVAYDGNPSHAPTLHIEAGVPGSSVCGNDDCEPGESCEQCPADCGECGPVCGNRSCEEGEDCHSCPQDCGPCGGDSTDCGPNTQDPCIDSPYRNYPNWCRVNVHMHPEESGAGVEAMEDAYRDLGYDLIFLTEHDQLVYPSADPGLVVAVGEEVSAREGHCNALGISELIRAGSSWQEVIDEAAAQGGLVQVNHPSRYGHTPADLDALHGLWAVEVKNQGQNDPSDEVLWDSQISQGKRLWGTFSDDAHITGVAGRGWLMVNTRSDCSQEAVLENMRIGNFYDSEGPTLDVWTDGAAVHVSSDTGVQIDWYIENMVHVQTTQAAAATYELDGSEVFVRAVVTDDSGKEAWTMPIFVTGP